MAGITNTLFNTVTSEIRNGINLDSLIILNTKRRLPISSTERFYKSDIDGSHSQLFAFSHMATPPAKANFRVDGLPAQVYGHARARVPAAPIHA